MKKSAVSLIVFFVVIGLFSLKQVEVSDSKSISGEPNIIGSPKNKISVIESDSINTFTYSKDNMENKVIIYDKGYNINSPQLYISDGILEITYKNNVMVIDKIQGMAKEDVEHAFNELFDKPEYTVLYSDNSCKYILVHYNLPSCGEYGSNVFVYVIKYDEELNTLENVFNYNDIEIVGDLDIERRQLKLFIENTKELNCDISNELDNLDYKQEILRDDTIIVTRPYKIDFFDYDGDSNYELDIYYPLLALKSNIYLNSLKITYKVDNNEFKLFSINYLEE